MGKSEIWERRALSAGSRRWQSRAAARAVAIGLAFAGSGALATPGGDIGTLALGAYVCELPGDAVGPAGRRVGEEGFVVIGASSYLAQGKAGTYLLTGRQLLMTSGPLRGRRYIRRSDRSLRAMGPDGSEQPLRCIRQPA